MKDQGDDPDKDSGFNQIEKAAELLKSRKQALSSDEAPARPVQPPGKKKRAVVDLLSRVPPPDPAAPGPAADVESRAAKSDHTLARTDAQRAAALAEASLPSDYVEKRRNELMQAQARSFQPALRPWLPEGTRLYEYELDWSLGIGGFGITYLAMDCNLQMQVAIKEYFPTDLVSRDSDHTVHVKNKEDEVTFRTGLEKFLNEARTLARFNHPNVVRVSRFFEMNETAYMVMAYESGRPLKEWIAANPVIDQAQMLQMFLPLLDGLQAVHDAGFLHRDIKPGNIFVRKDGSLVLLDFGAARHAIGAESRSLTSIVTPGYAPFEQYHSRGDQGPWTDLYALGGVLYWILTGSKPIEAPARIKSDLLPPASKVGAGRFNPSILAAIDWALVPDAKRRPRSIAEFREALTAATPVVPPEPDAGPPQDVAPAVKSGKSVWWKFGK